MDDVLRYLSRRSPRQDAPLAVRARQSTRNGFAAAPAADARGIVRPQSVIQLDGGGCVINVCSVMANMAALQHGYYKSHGGQITSKPIQKGL